MNNGWRNLAACQRGRGGSFCWRECIAGLICFVLCNGSLCADDAPADESFDSRPVPAVDRRIWPEGDWTPVSRALLEQFLKQHHEGGDIVAPAGPYIERIVYRGTLHDDLSFSGDFDAAIDPGDATSVLDLQQVSMYLGDLRWEDRSVEWGTADDGRFVMLIPDDAETLEGPLVTGSSSRR